MSNPWLGNVIANALDVLSPGERNQYNGMGFDLAGKVMELIAGRSIFRLMQEQLFLPLGIDEATIVDLGYGTMFTAEDLARVGQLVLNRGSYGEMRLFWPESFEEMMPVVYEDVFPAMEGNKGSYGFGFHVIAEKPLDAEGDEIADADPILSEQTYGHGSASSTVIRIDFDHDLVVAVTRFSAGPDYGKHLRQVLTAVAEGME
jgi:CubicO group peptidase (beta-lactamase class C family)